MSGRDRETTLTAPSVWTRIKYEKDKKDFKLLRLSNGSVAFRSADFVSGGEYPHTKSYESRDYSGFDNDRYKKYFDAGFHWVKKICSLHSLFSTTKNARMAQSVTCYHNNKTPRSQLF